MSYIDYHDDDYFIDDDNTVIHVVNETSKFEISDLRRDPNYINFFINGVGSVLLGLCPLVILFILNLFIYLKLTGRRRIFLNDAESRGSLCRTFRVSTYGTD